MFLLHCHSQRGEPILKQAPLSHNFAKVLLSLQSVNKLCVVLKFISYLINHYTEISVHNALLLGYKIPFLEDTNFKYKHYHYA